jgi:hypothetical protein
VKRIDAKSELRVKIKFKVESVSTGGEALNSENSAGKALLLRVGMDLGTGGALEPILRDGVAAEARRSPPSYRS